MRVCARYPFTTKTYVPLALLLTAAVRLIGG